MAVVDVKRDPKGTQGPVWTAEGATGQKRFTVLLDGADGPDDAPIVAAKAAGVPGIFSYWSAAAYRLRCTQKTADPLDGLKLWAITCQYATGPQSEDPLNEPPDISYDSMSVRDQWEYGVGNAPLVNSAGDPIKLEADLELSVLRIGRNVASHSLSQLAFYRDSVNARPILGAPEGTLWMKTYRASKVTQDDREYWREEMEIVFNHLMCPEPADRSYNRPANSYIGWMHRIANTGRHKRQLAGQPERDPKQDAKGELDDPMPLNWNGTDWVSADQTIWIYFQTKRAVDWAPLRLSID